MLDLYIVGAGGFGRELMEILWECLPRENYALKGFLAEDKGVPSEDPASLGIVSRPSQYQPQPQDRFVLAIGHIDARRSVVEDLQSRGGQFLSVVHPSAYVAKSAQIGNGAVLYPQTYVSHNAALDEFVHLNLYASVGHDARVGKFCLLAPYATINGFGLLDHDVYMSTHSTVAPQVRVGAHSKISANTAVMNDVAPRSFVFGVPGRQTRRLDV